VSKIIFQWLWDHRTKVVGYLGTIAGTLATSSVVSPKAAAWYLLISSLITSGIGHFNSMMNAPKTNEPPP
jgi:hypothetical protein